MLSLCQDFWLLVALICQRVFTGSRNWLTNVLGYFTWESNNKTPRTEAYDIILLANDEKHLKRYPFDTYLVNSLKRLSKWFVLYV